MSDNPNKAAAQKSFRAMVRDAATFAFGVDHENFMVRKFKERPESGIIVTIDNISWGVESIGGSQDITVDDFINRMGTYVKLHKGGGIVGTIIVSDKGLPSSVEEELSVNMGNLHHFTFERFSVKEDPINLHELQNVNQHMNSGHLTRRSIALANEVVQALKKNFERVNISAASANTPAISFYDENDPANSRPWGVLILDESDESMQQLSFVDISEKLSTLALLAGSGVVRGVLIVSRPKIPDRVLRSLAALTFPVRAATLDQLQRKDFDLTPIDNDEPPGEVVRIDLGSDKHQAAIKAMQELSYELRASNQPGLSPDTRDRLVKEVEAGTTLLSATTARIEALKAVVPPPLMWLMQRVVLPAALRKAAEVAWVAIKSLFSDEPDIWL